jgi:hypothetical protein
VVSILVIIWHLLTDPAARYTEPPETACTSAPVRYFDERDLASLGTLPAGFRLSSDLPSV